MARKIERKKTSRPEEGRDDLGILHPELTLTVAGREVTMREYGLVEGLRLRGSLQPFTSGLQVIFDNGHVLVEDVMDLIATHYDLLRVAIAQSAGVEPEWIDGLGDADGDLLLNAWWGVCGPFFVRQILRRRVERMRNQALAGAISMPNSSTPATEHRSSSGNTPNGNSSSSTND